MSAITKTILCVDDSPATLGTWIEALDQFGYRTIATTDPQAALPILGCVPVELALIDYFMPVLNGGTLAASIREHSAIPIILASNNTSDIPVSVREVVDAILPKQAGLASLVRTVNSLLSGNKS